MELGVEIRGRWNWAKGGKRAGKRFSIKESSLYGRVFPLSLGILSKVKQALENSILTGENFVWGLKKTISLELSSGLNLFGERI